MTPGNSETQKLFLMDTIYALSSAPGRAGVALFRVSGEGAVKALEKIAGVFSPQARKAILAPLKHPASGEEIDHALVIFFAKPASFTGEDVAEFHVHGGGAVVRALASALGAAGCRMAHAGEFTRRAFDHGKLDLAEVEGLADLIHAETEAQRKQALLQMDGALSEAIDEWRSDLTKIMAYSEAEIDFPDEDLPKNMADSRLRQLQELRAEIAGELAQKKRGEILRTGFRVAILGAPNAGKSSLLNLLARREAAIVSHHPGTTRDVVEVHMDIEGYPVILTDTAGLRETENPVEEEGIARAHRAARGADLKIVLFDATQKPDAASLALLDANAIAVINKIDLGTGDWGLGKNIIPSPESRVPNPVLALSARTGEGLLALMESISSKLHSLAETSSNAPLLTRERHAEALQEALNYLDRVLSSLAKKSPSELTAEELRLASRALGRITGEVDVGDLLDVIFRDFCIGK